MKDLNQISLQDLLIALEFFEQSETYDYDDPKTEVIQRAIEERCERIYEACKKKL
jgi:hypothetical protein